MSQQRNCKSCGLPLVTKRGRRGFYTAHASGKPCANKPLHANGAASRGEASDMAYYGFQDAGEYRMSAEFAGEMRAAARAADEPREYDDDR